MRFPGSGATSPRLKEIQKIGRHPEILRGNEFLNVLRGRSVSRPVSRAHNVRDYPARLEYDGKGTEGGSQTRPNNIYEADHLKEVPTSHLSGPPKGGPYVLCARPAMTAAILSRI